MLSEQWRGCSAQWARCLFWLCDFLFGINDSFDGAEDAFVPGSFRPFSKLRLCGLLDGERGGFWGVLQPREEKGPETKPLKPELVAKAPKR